MKEIKNEEVSLLYQMIAPRGACTAQHRREIDRAVQNAQRTDLDKWFRQ